MWEWLAWGVVLCLAIYFFLKAAGQFLIEHGTFRANKCGHMTKWQGVGHRFGRPIRITLDPRTPDYCIQCVAQMAIRCAFCSSIIDVRKQVALFLPDPAKLGQTCGQAYRDPKTGGYVVCASCTQANDPVAVWWPPGEVRHDIMIVPMRRNGRIEQVPVFIGDGSE